MDLHTAGHRRGVVCAPHSAAVETGRAILAEGGNVLEAMVAMAAMIAVAYPHMNHLGGDGYWLVREPSGRVRAFLAAGVAGARATPQLYRDAGHDTIPARGALEAAKGQGGRLPLADLLAPAARLAQDGFEPARHLALYIAGDAGELKSVP